VAGFLWYVYNEFDIQTGVPPSIGDITCNLQIPQNIFWNESGTFSVNVYAGSGPISYQWTVGKCGSFGAYCDWFGSQFPDGLTFPNGVSNSTFKINNGTNGILYQTKKCNFPDPYEPYPCCGGDPNQNIWMSVKVTVSNSWGSVTKVFPYTSPIAAYRPIQPPPPPPGCPYIYVFNNDTTNWTLDNNILHRSEFEEFVGSDVNDKYLLQVTPKVIDNKIAIQIRENEDNNNYFDEIKLYAVDHPLGTSVGITENNEIVLIDYVTVASSDDAALNGEDVTQNIQFTQYTNGGEILSGMQNDTMYAHYNEGDQLNAVNIVKQKYNKYIPSRNTIDLALIGIIVANEDESNTDRKPRGANIDIVTNQNTYSESFAIRELRSTVIIPFGSNGDVVDHVDIKWERDFTMNFFSVVPILYEGFTKTELALVEASHTNDGDVINQLLYSDGYNMELNSPDISTLWFNYIPLPPSSALVRDYVIEVKGRSIYNGTNLSPDNLLKVEKNILNYNYKLSLNYPNPFNPVTNINYQIAKNGFVKIEIFNNLGQLIRILVDEYKNSGSYDVKFDGSTLSSGAYYYRMKVNDFIDVKRMILVK